MRAALASMFAAAMLAVSVPAPTASAETASPVADQQTIVGLVTVNGEVPTTGVHVTVVAAADGEDERTCGDFVTGEGATFELILPAECGPGATAVFRVDTGSESGTVVEITEDPRLTATVDFQLSDAELEALGLQAQPSPDVAVVQTSPPLQGTDLRVVVLSTVIPATLLLVVMVLMKGSFWRRGAPSGGGSTSEDKGDGSYRSQIEGMVLVMVVLSVILLGVTGKIGSDGLVSVLAAIVGYTVGRQVGSKET
ncbi:hypothetical protein Q6350_10340 [Isoptericola sp. b515]|uniref:hypothetical protein n=1 Tax=Isoptericola sp. b515 TaxID=3064652 RepID=UPI002713F5EE|nr:hypothetical protein [Isoptericola sp. b515]MDO8148830.1 hypothetical protein [Isoptericola sp. b515]